MLQLSQYFFTHQYIIPYCYVNASAPVLAVLTVRQTKVRCSISYHWFCFQLSQFIFSICCFCCFRTNSTKFQINYSNNLGRYQRLSENTGRPVFHGAVSAVLLAFGRSFWKSSSPSRSTSWILLAFSRSFSTSFSLLEVFSRSLTPSRMLLEVLRPSRNPSRCPSRLLEVFSRSFWKSSLPSFARSFSKPSRFWKSFSMLYALPGTFLEVLVVVIWWCFGAVPSLGARQD